MRTTLLAFVITLLFISSFHISNAQLSSDPIIQQLQQDVKDLKQANSELRSDLKYQKAEFLKTIIESNDSMKVLRTEIENNKSNIEKIGKELGVKISDNKITVENQIKNVESTISKNTLYWIIAVLVIALLTILLFSLLKKQLTQDKTDLNANILQAKTALEEEGIKLDNKLIDLLATQLLLMKEERPVAVTTKAEEVNHELALKVADEIIRIQKNLGNMDPEVKGLKQLIASVKRIQDNFEANGYDLVEMLNKPYDQGMKVTANFRPDETMRPGDQIITRIIKPQVNFKGVMIQAAQVEVSVGE